MVRMENRAAVAGQQENRTSINRGRGRNRYRGRKGKYEKSEALLDRIAAMLTKLGQRGYAVHEATQEYRTMQIDPDTDTDPERTP